MCNNIFKAFLLCLFGFVLMGCSSESFKLEGNFPDAGEQTFRAVYVNEAGVQTIKALVEEGRFTMEGVAPNYTVLYLYGKNDKFIAKVAVKNGDNIKMRGTIKHSNLIEVKGSDVNEDWSDFRRENHLLYEEGKEHLLDKKIEEYIEHDGSRMAGLLLLLCDYSHLDDTKKVHELLNKIDEKARPASVLKAYTEMNAMMVAKNEPRKRFNSMMFYNENDSLEAFVPVRSYISILYFWGIDDARKDIVTELDSLYAKYDNKKQLQIVDVVLDSDTLKWKRALRRENTEWTHLWAVGGIMNKAVVDLQIKSTPEFFVLDSIGQPIYRGDSIEAVSKLINSKLKNRIDTKKNKSKSKKK
ncbi:MAG: DUF4369 domain-containing protein [Muribaculaceae bacterium]|nr:DUF4369 domain-containing protein [Muribaculaceae bacterium]